MQLSAAQLQTLETMFASANADTNTGDYPYAAIYTWLASQLSDSTDPNVKQVVMWLTGAAQANGNPNSLFSVLIREYTAQQGQLRGVSTNDDMQLASNNVAIAAINQIINSGGTIPDIASIASDDATAVGGTIFRSLQGDSAYTFNSAWSGSLLFSVLGNNQSYRLFDEGTPGTWMSPNLDTLKNVSFAFDSFSYAISQALGSEGSLVSTLVSSVGTFLQGTSSLSLTNSLSSTLVSDLGISFDESGKLLTLLFQGAEFLNAQGISLTSLQNEIAGCLFAGIMQNCGQPALITYIVRDGLPGVMNDVNNTLGRVPGPITSANYVSEATALFSGTSIDSGYSLTFLPQYTATQIAEMAINNAGIQAALLSLSPLGISGTSNASSTVSNSFEYWLERAELDLAKYAQDTFATTAGIQNFYSAHGLTAGTYEDHVTGAVYTDSVLPTSMTSQVVFGNGKTDQLQGGSGQDVLFGGYGKDTLIAGSGTETLVSGGGGNILKGGTGTNTYYVQDGDTLELGTVSNVIYIGPDAYELSTSYWDSSQQGFLTLDGSTLLTPEGSNALVVSHKNSDGTTTTFTISGVTITSNGDGYAPSVSGLGSLETFTMQDIVAGSNLLVYSAAHAVVGPDGTVSGPASDEIQVSAGSYLRLAGVNPADVTISVNTHQYEAPASGYSWEYGSGVSLTSTWITITDIVTGTILTFEDVGDPNNYSVVGGIIFGDGTEWTMADLEKYANGGTGLPSTFSQVETVGDSTLNFATSSNMTNLPIVSYTVKGGNDAVNVSLLTDKDLTIQGFKSSANAANRLIFSGLSSTTALFKQIGSDLLVIDPTDGSSITIANYFDSTINTANRQAIQFSNGMQVTYSQVETAINQINSPPSAVSDLWQRVTATREASGRLSFSVEPVGTAIMSLYSTNSSMATSLLSAFLSQLTQLSTIADFPDFSALREELLVAGGSLASEVLSMGASSSLAPSSTGAYTYTAGSTVSYLAGTSGGTYVDPQTSVTNDYLDGNTGSDILTGGLGVNVLDGHGGADVLTGGAGAGNTYLLGSSFGLQTIVNERSAGDTRSDTVQFTNGIVQSMVTLARAGNDLLLTLTGTSNQAIIRGYFVTASGSTTTGQVANIVFADGTTLTAAQVDAMNLPTVTDPSQTLSAPTNDTGTTLQAWGQGSTLIAGSGNDTLLGASGDDTLIAGTGNDTMQGGNGANTYIFGNGFGTDVINNTSANNAADTIILNAANSSSVTLTQSGVDLVITVAGQSGSITYKGFFNTSTTSPLQAIEFADGTTWNASQIHQESLAKTVYNLGGTGGSSYSYAYLSSYSMDVVQVAAGLSASDLSFVPTANNTLQIVVTSTGQTVEVTNWFSDGTNPPIVVQFADGSQLTWAQITASLPQSGAAGNVVIHSDGTSPLVAGSGNDVLFSSTGTEEIVGGPGQDVINVMGGAHTIEIGTGATTVNLEGYPMNGQTIEYSDTSGNLTYHNTSGEGSAPNVLQLASDITSANVTVSLVADVPTYSGGQVTSADIDLTLSTGQTITLEAAMTSSASTSPAIDAIKFGDGTSWSWSQLLAKTETHAGSDGLAHLAAGQTFGVSDGSAPLVAGSNSATLLSFSENDYLFGGTGNDNLIANAGYDILQAGSGNSTLTSSNEFYSSTTFSMQALPSLLDGGSGQSTLNLGGGIALADKGSSDMNLNGPTDVMLYNKGDGTDYVSSNASKLVVSLGNGISASDIVLSQSGYNLDLSIDGGEIVLENYLSPYVSHSNDVLQVFTNTGTASDATQLQSEDISLSAIVSAFRSAQAANPSLTSWSLSSALSSLSTTTETGEAYGGDVAAYYAMNGTLQNMSLSSAQATLTDSSFGSLQQLHQNLSGGNKTLLG